MKLHRFRQCCIAVLILTLLSVLWLPAQAVETEIDLTPAEFRLEDWPEDDERFAGKTWDEVAADFLSRHGIPADQVGLYYYNTVTGEEHDWNGDRYFTAGSTYKVPINMIYADRVSSGEMTLDDTVAGVPLRTIQRSTLRNSNNDTGELLIHDLGTYYQYKAAMTPYLCPPGEELDHSYDLANAFPAKGLGYALKLLYDEPERFPDVLDHMLHAQPEEYFRLKERRYVIAHKYGYYVDEHFDCCNDIGIAWTDEPIVIVMMTNFVANGVIGLADFAVLMCDYCEYWHARHVEEQLRIEAEERAAREAAERAEAERLAEEARLAEEQRLAEERAAAEAEAAARAVETAAAPDGETPEVSFGTSVSETQRTEAARRLKYGAALALAILLVSALFLLKKPARWPVAAVLALLLIAALLFWKLPAGDPAAAAPQTAEQTQPPSPTEPPAPTPTPEPTPTPTPEPTPEPIYEATLEGSGPEEIQALLEHPELRYVDASASTEYEALAALQRALPDCEVVYSLALCGETVDSGATELTLPYERIDVQELLQKLPWLPKLIYVDLTARQLSEADMDALLAACPDKKLVFTIHFAEWTVRSDITIFSSLFGLIQPPTRYGNQSFAPLFKYCTDLVALDVGHNTITDIEPIGRLTKLKVLILGDNYHLRDISPLANLTNLEYLELFMHPFCEDFSALNELTKMKDLCVGYCEHLEHADFVANMPDLEMCWLHMDGISAEEQEALVEQYPDVRFHFTPSTYSSTSDGWRETERNLAIRKAFRNWRVAEFRAWDDVTYQEGVTLVEVSPSDE